MGLLRMQPELKVYRTDFHWLEYLKTHGIFVLGHCGEVRGVPIRWRLFAVWWAQNLAFQRDIGLICSIYFFLSVWWLKWNFTNKFCESQLFFWNLPAILGTMFWVWSPDFETRLSRDSETDSKRKPEMRPWPCRLAECLMNLEVVVQFSERNLAVNKSLIEVDKPAWHANLGAHFNAWFVKGTAYVEPFEVIEYADGLAKSRKDPSGMFGCDLHHSVHAPMPQTLVLKMGWNYQDEALGRSLVDGVASDFCVFSSKISAKARPSDSQTTRCQEMDRMVRRIYGSAGGDVLEMCWRWGLLDIGDVQIASILS